MPFWILQLAELLAAVAFADLSLHVDRGDLLVGGTVAFGLLAVTAQGPLGIVRLVPRRLHVLIVCVVCVLFALAPILPQIRPDASGIIIVEFGAIGLFRLATLTRTDVTVRAPRRAGGRPSSTTPSVAGRAGLEAQAGATAAPTAGSGSGAGALSGTAAGPPAASGTPSTSEAAARWLAHRTSTAAQQASIAAQAAAMTAEKHAPAAKAQAGRALRSAGRLTGRLTRSSSPRSPAPDSSAPASPAASSSGADSPAAEPSGSPGPGSAEAGSSGTSGAADPSATGRLPGPEHPERAAGS